MEITLFNVNKIQRFEAFYFIFYTRNSIASMFTLVVQDFFQCRMEQGVCWVSKISDTLYPCDYSEVKIIFYVILYMNKESIFGTFYSLKLLEGCNIIILDSKSKNPTGSFKVDK